MNQSVTFVRNSSFLEKLVSSKVFWILFLAFIFSYPIYRSLNRELPAPLPEMFKVPSFKLVDEFGKPFSNNDLVGRYYIASFAFTSCPTTCPRLMEKLQVAQKRVKGLGTKIAILTITVDPEHDTPEILNKHARKLHANPFVWKFLSGDKNDLRKLVVDGFKVPMGDKEETTGVVDGQEVTMMDIAHTEKLVLVDSRGFVRGYYSIDDNGMNRLMIDIGLLVNQSYN